MQLNKWANEGLDILDSLLRSGSTKTLIRPFMKVLIDNKGNRIYNEAITKQRNNIIEKENKQ